jgi:hypothetical protein
LNTGKTQLKKLPNRKVVKLSGSEANRHRITAGYYESAGNGGGGGSIYNYFMTFKRITEAVLRWAFFALNLFMLSLYIIQN